MPPEAWDYRLGNHSALAWVLDQYKERTPKDPTICKKFKTYRFADYKDRGDRLAGTGDDRRRRDDEGHRGDAAGDLTQAKGEARGLDNFLADSQFKQFVQPVVVFPGWYVQKFDLKALGVWVLEPKALDAFIDNQPVVLSLDQVRAMASALSSHIRIQSRL